MYILNIVSAMKKVVIKLLKGFLYKKYKQIGLPKENSYYSKKRQKSNIYYHLQPNQWN